MNEKNVSASGMCICGCHEIINRAECDDCRDNHGYKLDIIQRVNDTSQVFRALLVKDAQRHCEKQCNGDYYFNEDLNEWKGYLTDAHRPSLQLARIGKAQEKSIVKRLRTLLGTATIPDFITYQGDPRGFVLYFMEEKLSAKEKALCEKLGFMRDWGGNYAILKEGEQIV